MDVGLVGLGRMGANMARRWRRHGHTVIGYARPAATVEGSRFTSWGEATYSNRVLSAMRWGFGGHVEIKKGEG